MSHVKLKKIRPVGVELCDADRRTDTAKLIVAFRNVGTAPKNSTFYPQFVCVFCMAMRTNIGYFPITALTD
jgi:hypothetical protein